MTLLNLLILLSLLLVPALVILTANNVAEIASSIKLDNTTQSLNNGKFTLSSVLTIRNPGPFNAEAGITASVKGSQGTPISVTAPKLTVKAGSPLQRIPVSVEIDLRKVSEEDVKRLASRSENFIIELSANIGIPPITSLAAEATAQITWLPPIHNFTVGQPIIRGMTPTQIKVEVPFSFDNQSPFFTVNEESLISVFNSTGQQVGGGTLIISAQPSTKWSDSAKITLSPPTNLGDLLLKDATLRYRADVDFSLSGLPIATKLSKNIVLNWGAPIKNPQITTTLVPVNSTHTKVIATLSFKNNNNYLTVDGSITPKLVKASGNTWMGNTQQVQVTPGESASLNFSVIVPNSQLMSTPVKVVLGIETQLGSVDLEVGSIG
jgi:hypothetical protein